MPLAAPVTSTTRSTLIAPLLPLR